MSKRGASVFKATLSQSGTQGDRGIEMLPRITVGSKEPRFVRLSGRQGLAMRSGRGVERLM